jgi:hypothetical protein
MVKRRIARQLLGTLVAVLAGWLTALLFLEAATAFELLQQPHYIVPEALFVTPIDCGLFMSFFILPVWALVLVPLYLLVPPSSVLWRWPICTVCGAAAGLVIIGVFFGRIPGVGRISSDAWDFYVLAAIVGGVTCLTGALTKHMFKPTI